MLARQCCQCLAEWHREQVGAAVLCRMGTTRRGDRRLGLNCERRNLRPNWSMTAQTVPSVFDQLTLPGDEVVSGSDAFRFQPLGIRIQIRGGIARPGDLTRWPGARSARVSRGDHPPQKIDRRRCSKPGPNPDCCARVPPNQVLRPGVLRIVATTCCPVAQS